jgi:hypothetical protein
MEEVYVLGVKGNILEVTSEGVTRTLAMTGDWERMSTGKEHGKGYFYRMGSTDFLTFGLEQTETSVFYVSAREGNTVQISNLIEVRIKPGVIFYSGHVYVFGGFDGSGLELKNSAERLTLSSQMEELATATWQPLPYMTYPRASFLPCQYNGKIYLCGGFTRYCEAYNPGKNRYKDLPISLREFDARSHLAVFVNMGIVVLSRRWVTLWRPRTKETYSYEIDAIVDPYSSGGVQVEVIPPAPPSEQAISEARAKGVRLEEEKSSSCNLYYVYRGQLVCVTLPTKIGS